MFNLKPLRMIKDSVRTAVNSIYNINFGCQYDLLQQAVCTMDRLIEMVEEVMGL
jgi:hypothetical protein